MQTGSKPVLKRTETALRNKMVYTKMVFMNWTETVLRNKLLYGSVQCWTMNTQP
jgi:hypothetical protein